MSLPSLPSLPPAVYIAGLASFAVSVLLVLTKRWHGRFSMDGLSGVQKMHSTPTPLIGGLATPLTTKGIAEKVALTNRFISCKMEEYEALNLAIEAFKSEVDAPWQNKTQQP